MIRKPRNITDAERHEWRSETARDTKLHVGEEGATPPDCVPAPKPLLKAKTPAQRSPSDSSRTTTSRKSAKAVSLIVGDFSRLDPNTAKRFNKPHVRRDGQLDLHDMNQEEAFAALQHFCARANERGWRSLRIITGKGRGGGGVLRAQVPHWLEVSELAPRMVAMSYAQPREGGEGVLLVLLSRPR